MQIIDYPGNFCSGIYKAISLIPFARRAWQYLFAAIIIFLVGTSFYKMSKPNRINSLIYFKWLFSPILFISISCVGILILRVPNLLLPIQNIDESFFIVEAASYFKGGYILWKNISGCTSGPLNILPLNVMLVFGGLNYASIRLFGLICCILPAIYITWKTLVMLFGEIIARLCTIILFTFFASINDPDLLSYSSETIPVLLITISVYVYFNFITDNSLLVRKIACLGFFLGMIPYAKLQAVPIGLVIAVLAIIEIIRNRERSGKKKCNTLLIFLSAAVLPSFLISIYLLIHNCWSDFWKDYILNNLFYLNGGSHENLKSNKLTFISIYIQHVKQSKNFYLLFTCLLSIAAASIISSPSRQYLKNNFYNKIFLSILSITLVSCYCVIAPGNPFTHYILLAIMPFILLLGAVIRCCGIELNKNKIKIFFCCYLIIILADSLSILHNFTNEGINFALKGENYTLSEVDKTIKKYTHANEKMSIWGWKTNCFVETGLLLGNRYPDSWYTLGASKGSNRQSIYLNQFLDDLSTNKPVIFLDAVSAQSFIFTDSSYRHEHYPIINDFVSQNYMMMGNFDGVRVYVIKSRLKEMGIANDLNAKHL